MIICCDSFKDLIKNIDDAPSLVFRLNIDDKKEINFDLAFTQKSLIGQSWQYLNFCPFCGIKLERGLY